MSTTTLTQAVKEAEDQYWEVMRGHRSLKARLLSGSTVWLGEIDEIIKDIKQCRTGPLSSTKRKLLSPVQQYWCGHFLFIKGNKGRAIRWTNKESHPVIF